MVKQDRYYGVDRYLPHAVITTASVVLIPLTLVVVLMIVLDGQLAPLIAAVLGAVLALMVAGIGSILWSHTPGAIDVSFGELLIWGWMRRKRAEERAARNARLLGLDNHGRPVVPARSARAQQLAILGDLSSALESKDPYTHGHSQRVERHSIRTAEELGLSVEQLAELRRAAALHDVGKIRVPHRILRKPGSLTPDERRIIEQHSVVGAWLVSNVCRPEVVVAVRHHHERWDGRGYPDGLAREHIPLYARIIAVADAFDAMTSSRPYRVAYDSRTAIGILEAEAGAQFDPSVVRAFVSTVPDRVPIAAFLPFIGAGLWRKVAGGLRRGFSGTAMSGAVTAGAAAILIASVLSPVDAPMAGPDGAQAAPPAAAGPASPTDPPTVPIETVDRKNGAKVKSGTVERPQAPKRSIPARKTSTPQSNGEILVLSDHITKEPKAHDGGPPAPDRRGPDPRRPDAGNGEPGDGEGEEPPSDGDDGGDPDNEKPEEPKDPKKVKEAKGDPQPEHGNDCPAKPGSPGSAKHCG